MNLGEISLPDRDSYTIMDILSDLKLIEATPTITYQVACDIFYYELRHCSDELGGDATVTQELKHIIDFMQNDYERMLVEAELHEARHKPKAAIETLEKSLSEDIKNYELIHSAEQVRKALHSAKEARMKEIEQYKKIEEGIRREIKETPDDPNLYNQLRLLLWIQGRYRAAKNAYVKATKRGWTPETSKLVAL
ncbi:hypothetical protein EU538_04345 [Candidatus Thorarchaeota archaeon]|nr:MAG: hypothetical protein EU538_04345 [Candidatus Thorarchaeota archaeon]